MTAITSRSDVLFKSLRLTVADKSIVSPATGCRELVRIVLHNIEALAVHLNYQVVAVLIVEKIKDENRSILVLSAGQSTHRFGISIYVVDTPKWVFQSMTRLNDH